MNSHELYHHGIKGQKWGIRRFQNSDGSLTNAGRKRRSLSDKQKKTIKTALKVGAVAAGTALLVYGAYKLNQKSTQALIDSYSDVGKVFSNFAVNNYDIAYNKLISEEQDSFRGLKDSANVHSHSSSYHNKLGKIDEWIADDYRNKAGSKQFSSKERAEAAAKVLTKGTKSFGKTKRQKLLDAAEIRARELSSG